MGDFRQQHRLDPVQRGSHLALLPRSGAVCSPPVARHHHLVVPNPGGTVPRSAGGPGHSVRKRSRRIRPDYHRPHGQPARLDRLATRHSQSAPTCRPARVAVPSGGSPRYPRARPSQRDAGALPDPGAGGAVAQGMAWHGGIHPDLFLTGVRRPLSLRVAAPDHRGRGGLYAGTQALRASGRCGRGLLDLPGGYDAAHGRPHVLVRRPDPHGPGGSRRPGSLRVPRGLGGPPRPPAGGRRGGVKPARARRHAPRGPGGMVDAGKRVLLLLPTTTYRAHDFIRAAGRLGVETVVGSDRKQALQDLQPTRGVTLDLQDPEKAAGQIADFDAKHHLNAVIPTDDETAVVAAAASARLRLPHNPPEAARAARRKDVLRRVLHDAHVPTPRFSLMTLEDDPGAAARKQIYPVVLKPTFLAASRGVIRADDEEQFVAAFRRIAVLLGQSDVKEHGGDAGRLVLVEEFVPGVEVALEGILLASRLKVLALFDKPDPLDGPFFEETIYVTPSRLTAGVQKEIDRK